MKRIEEYNHLYPAFHIRKWIDCGGQVYDKTSKKTNKCRVINYKKDFTGKFYYSLGKVDNELEKRLSVFEHEVAPLIDRIDTRKVCVQLSTKELELIKLYCVLCASRQDNTCEVIKNDESCFYKSNNYLFGTFRNATQEEAVSITAKIVDEFERVKSLPDVLGADIGGLKQEGKEALSIFTIGLHISIIRAETPILLVSDRFCIIENTMDSDHLYTYVPISPKTALLLVKSKYYYNKQAFVKTKQRFGEKYGNGYPDAYLSDLFGAEVGDYESCLFCDYKKTVDEKLEQKAGFLNVEIHTLPKEIFQLFNSIYCEDGEKILFCDKEELDFALTHQLQCRDIVIG